MRKYFAEGIRERVILNNNLKILNLKGPLFYFFAKDDRAEGCDFYFDARLLIVEYSLMKDTWKVPEWFWENVYMYKNYICIAYIIIYIYKFIYIFIIYIIAASTEIKCQKREINFGFNRFSFVSKIYI